MAIGCGSIELDIDQRSTSLLVDDSVSRIMSISSWITGAPTYGDCWLPSEWSHSCCFLVLDYPVPMCDALSRLSVRFQRRATDSNRECKTRVKSHYPYARRRVAMCEACQNSWSPQRIKLLAAVRPDAPPLGLKLFAALRARGGAAATIGQDGAARVINFEAGMEWFFQERSQRVSVFLCKMAIYFA